jgi:uncharacterized protein DUF4189
MAVVGFLTIFGPSPVRADCADDCQAAYRSCRGNPDSCLAAQGVCLNRCTLDQGPHRERHGAIAYSARKQVYGYSYDYDSEKAAGDVAVRNCRRQDGDADDCRVLVTFHNACGALARGDKGAHGVEWGHTGREAATKALDKCRARGGASCKIERQVCSGAR